MTVFDSSARHEREHEPQKISGMLHQGVLIDNDIIFIKCTSENIVTLFFTMELIDI